jgi:cysteine desulfurase
MESENPRLANLSNMLVGEILQGIPDVRINGYPRCLSPCATPCALPHVVSLTFDGIDGEALVYRLDAEGIRISAGSACTAGSPDPSHVIIALGIPPETALGTVRISLGEDSTEEGVHAVAEAVVRLVTDLRRM